LQDSYIQATEKIKTFDKNKLLEKSRNENIMLKTEINELRNDLTYFIKLTETFQKSMGSQRDMFDKTGLGFNVSQNQKIYENFFIPEKEKMKCPFCNKDGHLESFCFHKKRALKENPERSFMKRNECSYCKRIGHLEVNCFLKIKHPEIKKTNIKGPKPSWAPKERLTQNAKKQP